MKEFIENFCLESCFVESVFVKFYFVKNLSARGERNCDLLKATRKTIFISINSENVCSQI